MDKEDSRSIVLKKHNASSHIKNLNIQGRGRSGFVPKCNVRAKA
jgi:hypothetical protein